MDEDKKEKKVKLATILIAVVVIIAGYLLIVGVLIYGFNMDNFLTRKTAQYFPYPAAIVGNKVITINQLQNRLSAAQKFYENQDFSGMGIRVDFSTPDGKKRLAVKEHSILGKMVEDAVIEKEANSSGIHITPQEISQAVQSQMDQYGSSDDVKNNMQKLYGWTVADFENNIVKPDMYQEKLYDDFKNKDAGFAAAKAKIEQAQKDLNGGSDFQTVVGKYSEGDSAKDKGDLGWFGSEEMLPEIAQVAFSMDAGKNSDIIESSLGYHIIQILDKKNEDGEDKVHIQQIFVRTPSFSDWLAEKEKATRIYIPIREFSWNKDSGDVDFRDDAMKQFEEKVKENPNGDISVLF